MSVDACLLQKTSSVRKLYLERLSIALCARAARFGAGWIPGRLGTMAVLMHKRRLRSMGDGAAHHTRSRLVGAPAVGDDGHRRKYAKTNQFSSSPRKT